MSTSKQHAQAERARAIAEALQASGARSLMELLAESERHKEQLDRLCAKLEASGRLTALGHPYLKAGWRLHGDGGFLFPF